MRQDTHGFTPHFTLAYVDDPPSTFPSLPEDNPEKITFKSIWVAWGNETWEEIHLT